MEEGASLIAAGTTKVNQLLELAGVEFAGRARLQLAHLIRPASR